LTVRQQTLRVAYTKGRYLASVDSSSERRSVYRRGQTGSKATVYEQEELKPRYPTSGSRAARAELPAPHLERISDPQIPPTRQNFNVEDQEKTPRKIRADDIIPPRDRRGREKVGGLEVSAASPESVTQLLKAWGNGEQQALDRLIPLV